MLLLSANTSLLKWSCNCRNVCCACSGRGPRLVNTGLLTTHLNPHGFSSWIISHMISDVPRHIETNSETCFATIRNRTQRVLSVFALWRRLILASCSVLWILRKLVPFVRTQFIVSACGSVGRRTEIGRERPKQTVHAIESYREVTAGESRHDHVADSWNCHFS